MENIRTYEFAHIATLKPHALQIRRAYQSADLHNENAKDNLLQENDKDGQYNGYLSDATKRTIKKRIDNWLLSMKYTNGLKNPMRVDANIIYPTFVTLTLPSKQIHSDQKIKNELLDPYIEWLRKTFAVTAYFWRAESQKNGNVHFHILIDRYVPYGEIRRKWNLTANRLGYVDRYAQIQKFKFRYGYTATRDEIESKVSSLDRICKQAYKTGHVKPDTLEELKKLLLKWKATKKTVSRGELVKIAEKMLVNAYENAKKENYKNPPSTEIKSIQNIASVTAYITKYVTKDGKKPIGKGETIVKKDGKDVIQFKEIEIVNGEQFEIEKYKPVEFETRKVRGHLWGCSDTLRAKGIDYFKADIAYEVSWLNKKQEFERSVTVVDTNLSAYVDNQIRTADRVINMDFIRVIPMRKPIADGLPVAVMDNYRKHYQQTFNLIYAKAV